jgi:hypothetical protein
MGLVAAQDDKRFYCTELAVDCYGGRKAGWKLGPIIYPAAMASLGTVVFDSGPRSADGGRDRAAPRAQAPGRARRPVRAEVAPGSTAAASPTPTASPG